MAHQATVSPAGPFSLAAGIRFVEAFTPAALARPEDGPRPTEPGHLHAAFPVERSWEPAGVCVRQPDGDGGAVVITWEGPDDPLVAEQAARILCLDVDGTGFAAAGRADPVVRRLQAGYPGLRPVLFWSPYEAAVWSVLVQRTRVVQAASAKAAIARAHGEEVAVPCGERLYAFPAPDRLRAHAGELPTVPVKQQRLAGLADAADPGEDDDGAAPVLDAAHLRALEPADALAALEGLDGIGPFSAELILVRGAGSPDHFPAQERKLHAAMRAAYDRPAATPDELAAIAERWRPFRSWAALLFRTSAEDRQPARG